MDEPLQKILMGTWDLAAEAMKLQEIVTQRKKLEEAFKKIESLFQSFQKTGDSSELITELDQSAKDIPERAMQFSLIKFQVLSSPKGDADAALVFGETILDSDLGEDLQMLNNLAWILVSPDRVKKADAKLLKFALKTAVKADNLAKREDPSIADTLAKAYFDNGQLEKAVETQERVVELISGTQLENDPSMKKRLRQYKRALESSKKEPETKEDASEKN